MTKPLFLFVFLLTVLFCCKDAHAAFAMKRVKAHHLSLKSFAEKPLFAFEHATGKVLQILSPAHPHYWGKDRNKAKQGILSFVLGLSGLFCAIGIFAAFIIFYPITPIWLLLFIAPFGSGLAANLIGQKARHSYKYDTFFATVGMILGIVDMGLSAGLCVFSLFFLG